MVGALKRRVERTVIEHGRAKRLTSAKAPLPERTNMERYGAPVKSATTKADYTRVGREGKQLGFVPPPTASVGPCSVLLPSLPSQRHPPC